MLAYQCLFLLHSVNSFKLPNFNTKVQSEIHTDSHSVDAHNSIVNSSIEAFEFNINIGSVNICVSIILLILIIVIHRRSSGLLFRLSSRVAEIAKTLDMLSQDAC
jgi:beta-lactamase regulating signal transducer with metallopeptidase domain